MKDCEGWTFCFDVKERPDSTALLTHVRVVRTAPAALTPAPLVPATEPESATEAVDCTEPKDEMPPAQRQLLRLFRRPLPQWLDPGYWQLVSGSALLTLGQALDLASAWGGPDEEARLRRCGHCRLNFDWEAPLAELAAAMEKLQEHGLPPVFVFVFDQPWQLLLALFDAVANLLGQEVRMSLSVFAWALCAGEVGSNFGQAHRDKSYKDCHSDGRLGMVTTWIPLVPVTEESGCMYVVPGPADPLLEADGREHSRPSGHELGEALPCDPGEVLVWKANLIHWGAAYTAGLPRRSLATAFVAPTVNAFDAMETAPAAAVRALDLPTRLRIVVKSLLQYKSWKSTRRTKMPREAHQRSEAGSWACGKRSFEFTTLRTKPFTVYNLFSRQLAVFVPNFWDSTHIEADIFLQRSFWLRNLTISPTAASLLIALAPPGLNFTRVWASDVKVSWNNLMDLDSSPLVVEIDSIWAEAAEQPAGSEQEVEDIIRNWLDVVGGVQPDPYGGRYPLLDAATFRVHHVDLTVKSPSRYGFLSVSLRGLEVKAVNDEGQQQDLVTMLDDALERGRLRMSRLVECSQASARYTGSDRVEFLLEPTPMSVLLQQDKNIHDMRQIFKQRYTVTVPSGRLLLLEPLTGGNETPWPAPDPRLCPFECPTPEWKIQVASSDHFDWMFSAWMSQPATKTVAVARIVGVAVVAFLVLCLVSNAFMFHRPRPWFRRCIAALTSRHLFPWL
ncbi:unnamed protein product [Effrenium voratum]|nr:unnamed protein product [Effrenium voratum]